MKIFYSIRRYNKKNLRGDIVSGIVVAAMSIPIAIGYAQVAGLPPVYGLYGSVLPTLLFAIFSTSPQMVFGVDAAPAAMVGGILATANIAAGSQNALSAIPLITFFTAVWLLTFSLFKAGKLTKYISSSVMGGFISGIAFSIILMQIPKLVGGTAGSGELLELLRHLVESFTDINVLSLLLGTFSLAAILILKKHLPKFPAAVVIMIFGAAAQAIFHLDRYGVDLLPSVKSGLPQIRLLSLRFDKISEYLGMSLPIAIIVMTETLLSSNNFAMKNGYKLDDNSEIRTYAFGNFLASLIGCCPVSGSISRTYAGEQLGGKTQVLSLVSCSVIVLILLFGTGFIALLPIPILTAIVISSLVGVIETDLVIRLFKVDKKEFKIFISAFVGVLVLGPIYGVVLGTALSFISVLSRAASPSREFLGVISGRLDYFSLKRNKSARPIDHVVIYRFNNSLFFANIGVFQEDIENSIQDDTKVVIVDASSISSIDLAAADRIGMIYDKLKSQGIRFYLTEHMGHINDQLRAMGCERLLREGAVRRKIASALLDSGFRPPYNLAGVTTTHTAKKGAIILSEFEWLFGDDAEYEMERYARKIISSIHPTEGAGKSLDEILKSGYGWNTMNEIETDDLLKHLERHIAELAERMQINENVLMTDIINKRHIVEENLKKKDLKLYSRLMQHREKSNSFKIKNP